MIFEVASLFVSLEVIIIIESSEHNSGKFAAADYFCYIVRAHLKDLIWF